MMNKRFVTLPRVPLLLDFQYDPDDDQVDRTFTFVSVSLDIPVNANKAEVDAIIRDYIYVNCKEYFRRVLQRISLDRLSAYVSGFDYDVNYFNAYTSDGLVFTYAFKYTCLETEESSNKWAPSVNFQNMPYVVMFDNSVDNG